MIANSFAWGIRHSETNVGHEVHKGSAAVDPPFWNFILSHSTLSQFAQQGKGVTRKVLSDVTCKV